MHKNARCAGRGVWRRVSSCAFICCLRGRERTPPGAGRSGVAGLSPSGKCSKKANPGQAVCVGHLNAAPFCLKQAKSALRVGPQRPPFFFDLCGIKCESPLSACAGMVRCLARRQMSCCRSFFSVAQRLCRNGKVNFTRRRPHDFSGRSIGTRPVARV